MSHVRSGVASRPEASRPAGLTAIKTAAREIFAERGYHGTSIRDIAKSAGVSLAALYHYYAGKQELLFALLEESTTEYFATCNKALADAGTDPVARLGALVRAVVEYRVRRRVESNLMLSELGSLEPRYYDWLMERYAASRQLFQGIVDDGVARGAFRTPYPTDARRAIMAMCNAIAQWYDVDGELSLAQLADRYVALALTIVGHPADR